MLAAIIIIIIFMIMIIINIFLIQEKRRPKCLQWLPLYGKLNMRPLVSIYIFSFFKNLRPDACMQVF